MAKLYDDVEQETLQRVTDLAEDNVRMKIDQGIAEALGVTDDVEPLRRLLAEEPLFED